MKFGSYLEKHQPLFYKTLSNAINLDRVSHAYLLSGDPEAPLMESAIFMAQSLLCDRPSPLADEDCKTCRAIKENSYPGLAALGLAGAPIKKSEVEEIIANFSLTPLGDKKRLIYIINGVETMTQEAVNSILKFLEEPPEHVIAILTTYNEAMVLPTIISRCECIRLLLAPRGDVAKDAIALGVSKEDAEILSCFYNNAESIVPVSESDGYKTLKQCLKSFLDAIPLGENAMYLSVIKDILPTLGDGVSAEAKKNARFFLDLLSMSFKNAISVRERGPISMPEYAKLIEPLTRLPSLERCLLEILKDRALLDLNIPTGMLFDHIVYVLSQERPL